MTTIERDPFLDALTARWWAPLIRGIAAIVFGVLTFVTPGISLAVLVLLWGVYAITDGVFALAASASSGRAGRRWGWLLFEGLVSIAAGILTFVWPAITAVVLLAFIGAWAFLTGIAEIAAAIRLRAVIRHEWLLALSGVLSIALGVILFARPTAGALAVLWAIGAYAILFGVVLIALSMRLYRFRKGGERPIPTGGTPTPA